MDVFILGAGKPAHGEKPSSLKTIAQSTRAMDWLIHCFESLKGVNSLHFLGGYHVEDVIKNYPDLKFTVIPDWESRSVLHTFLNAPFSSSSAMITYSDTIFRKEILETMLAADADVIVGIDQGWRDRYNRDLLDIKLAETINFLDIQSDDEVEFTGLIYFNEKAISHIRSLSEEGIGNNLIDLLYYLKKQRFNILPFDLSRNWAEFNSPKDIAKFILGTKADTLKRLESRVSTCKIGNQVCFTLQNWLSEPSNVLTAIARVFRDTSIIVRSSSKNEDSWTSSNAGEYQSILNVDGNDSGAISEAINQVINSYGNHADEKEQVLVQQCISNVAISGVVFTCSLNTGAPYYHFNFDDKSNSTESVTSGSSVSVRTIILSRFKTDLLAIKEPKLIPVLKAVQELEALLQFDKLDIEFAVDLDDSVHIFQVRPITVDHSHFEIERSEIEADLFDNQNFFLEKMPPSPFLFGDETIFANMPDWNPAEIIGTSPKPLAFSLYRHLITNDVWAKQRFEFGYQDVRPCPLMYSFSGHPYIDTRASLNSFIPAELPESLKYKLAQAYLNILKKKPNDHDKIEFNVAFTIWTPDFYESAIDRLEPYGMSSDEILELESALKKLTCVALGRLESDIKHIDALGERRKNILSSQVPLIDKVFLLIEDCKALGNLPFAHAARAGFVATTLLKSFISKGIFSENRVYEFMGSLQTIAGEFERDKFLYGIGELNMDELVEKYGHLRPGTYELFNQAYWEDPSRYISSLTHSDSVRKTPFSLSQEEQIELQKVLFKLGSSLTPIQLMHYIERAIISREAVKFQFTHNVSKALDFCIAWGGSLGISREDLSYLTYSDLEQFKLHIVNANDLKIKIKENKNRYRLSALIELPHLISSSDDFFCFERQIHTPNFVTMSKTLSNVSCFDKLEIESLEGSVVLIPQADPGFDWLFGHKISGLITLYGGANSHMAIRAAEMSLPAAIGVGESLYEQISKMKLIELDCANRIIREVL